MSDTNRKEYWILSTCQVKRLQLQPLGRTTIKSWITEIDNKISELNFHEGYKLFF